MKRLKVSEEEHGVLSFSILEIGSSVSTAVLPPLPGTVIEGVGAAISTEGSTGSGWAAGARGYSTSLYSFQVN